MKTFKKIKNHVVAIFIILAILRIAFVLIFLPYLINSFPNSYTNIIVLIDILFILLLLLLIYFFSANFNKKLQEEKEIAADIHNRYQALSIATDDAIWDHDLLTSKTFYNERLVQMFGYAKSDLEDNETWWIDNIHPEDKLRVANKINDKLKNSNNLWLDEYRFRAKDGSYKEVRDRSYIVRNPAGQPVRLIGAMNDITLEKKLQKNLVEEKLLDKNKLGKAIIQMQEEERKNIRYELHEDVNQILAAVKMSIQQHTGKSDFNDPANKSAIYLEDVINKIRKISNELSPGGLEFFGLVSSISEVINYNEHTFPVKIWLDVSKFNEAPSDYGIKIFIYRIIREILSIIIENSGLINNQIHIKLETINQNTAISVTYDKDNSHHNNPSKIRKLVHIKNKVEMYNGTLRIEKHNDNRATMQIYL